MPLVGLGVIEIRVHADGEFRVFYVVRHQNAVHVLHAFQKKTQRTRAADINLAAKRYQELRKERQP